MRNCLGLHGVDLDLEWEWWWMQKEHTQVEKSGDRAVWASLMEITVTLNLSQVYFIEQWERRNKIEPDLFSCRLQLWNIACPGVLD